MVVVSYTSPIVNLAAVGHLHLLPALFGKITVPDAVYREIVVEGAGRPGADEVLSANWIEVQAVQDRRLVRVLEADLHSGEAEALALALELGADWALLDEQAARRSADALGLTYTGLLGVLERAKAKGTIPAVKPLLDALRHTAGFWISAALYTHILNRVKE
ncbi:MAG: DUF3368 domain-containing protein [Rhodothermales bacterium]